MFGPGDVVECVDASPLLCGPGLFSEFNGLPCGLQLGRLYTVEEAFPSGEVDQRDGCIWLTDAVTLRELIHPIRFGTYGADRFRLLKRRDPDLLRRLMHQPVPELEPA